MILAYAAHGSRIHGRGLFACEDGEAGERVRAPDGSPGFNHSCAPNARLVPGFDSWVGADGILNVTHRHELTRDVRAGEEVTLDYRERRTPEFLRALECACPVCSP